MRPGLTCHIEIDASKGDTYRDIVAAIAEALRATSVKIEARELDTGFHPVKTADGHDIGEVYLDYYETERD